TARFDRVGQTCKPTLPCRDRHVREERQREYDVIAPRQLQRFRYRTRQYGLETQRTRYEVVRSRMDVATGQIAAPGQMPTDAAIAAGELEDAHLREGTLGKMRTHDPCESLGRVAPVLEIVANLAIEIVGHRMLDDEVEDV